VENLNLFKYILSFQPDVTTTETVPDDEFLVIACDGIWNSMSSQQCCDFIMERIGKMELKEITAEV
jgi:serine/threonine protein phosphatase PrpC